MATTRWELILVEISLNESDPRPVFQQIAYEIRKLVALGKLTAGEELPRIRDLAVQLTINPNTISRAYQELVREGVVITRGAGGTHIVSAPGASLASRERRKILAENATKLLEAADELKANLDEVVKLLREVDEERKQ